MDHARVADRRAARVERVDPADRLADPIPRAAARRARAQATVMKTWSRKDFLERRIAQETLANPETSVTPEISEAQEIQEIPAALVECRDRVALAVEADREAQKDRAAEVGQAARGARVDPEAAADQVDRAKVLRKKKVHRLVHFFCAVSSHQAIRDRRFDGVTTVSVSCSAFVKVWRFADNVRRSDRDIDLSALTSRA